MYISEPKYLVPIVGMMNGEKNIPTVEKKAIIELNNLSEELVLEKGNFH